MNTQLTIKLHKRTQTGWLMWMLIVLPFIFPSLTGLLGLPHMVRYSLDVSWVLLFVYLILAQRQGNQSGVGKMARLIVVFFIYTAVTYIAQYQSVFYYLWGVRSNFRFFVAFLAFVMFLKGEDITYYFKFFDLMFWINAIVMVVQYYGYGLEGDYLGGLFGADKGANSYTIIFFTIVLTRDILLYLERKKSLRALLTKCAVTLFVVALAEIKFFFFLFFMIVVMAVLFTNFTWRKVWVLAGSAAAILGFAVLLETLFPMFEGFLTLDFISEYAGSDKGYTGQGDLNRLTAIPLINKAWLRSFWEQLVGMGLGNCDAATGVDFLTSPFFLYYGYTHYSWFSYAFLYLETGWVGLAFYYGFFILVLIGARRIEKRSEGASKMYCSLCRIMAICCMILAVYNNGLRTEAAYMMFFVLAVPFALDRERKEKEYRYDKRMGPEARI